MCGVFGAIRTEKSWIGEKRFKHLVRNLGIEAQVRGTHATGIAFNINNKLNIVKSATPAASFPFISSIPNDVKAVLGHTRYTTQGSHLININNHPFKGRVKGKSFALAHNGVLLNDVTLRRQFGLPKTRIETDSYVAVQLLERMGKLDMKNIKTCAEELMGSFVLTVMDDKNNFWFVKGDNPLYLVNMPEIGLLVYGSTKEIVENAFQKDSMLYLYYKSNLDNKDTTRVAVLTPQDGVILYYNYEKQIFDVDNFTLDIGYNTRLNYSKYGYSYNYLYDDFDYDYYWYSTDKSTTTTTPKTNLPVVKDETEKLPKPVACYEWIKNEDGTWVQSKIGSTRRYRVSSDNYYGEYEVICSSGTGDEVLTFFGDDGRIEVLDLTQYSDIPSIKFDNISQYKDWLEVFDAEGFYTAYHLYPDIIKHHDSINKKMA
jgi:glucosamine 6-phosphate synthetase-like amidotransferase/phosphosugar isomerase protein